MRMSLVIKARDVLSAQVYAYGWGFAVLGSPIAVTPDLANITLLVEGNEEAAARWLSEPSHIVEGQGFEYGTLLIYREVEPKTARLGRLGHARPDQDLLL